MNYKVKIIKRGERKNPQPECLEQPGHPTREITTTIKLWVSEFKQRQRETNVVSPRKRVAA
jgi:hypothetical protein